MLQTPPIPKVSAGTIVRLSNVSSRFISARNVDVWLPPGYSKSKKYSVLYMHDGQMLFDAKTTWNKQEWKVDEVASDLIAKGKVQEFIVVGVWNGGASRFSEYFPSNAVGYLPALIRKEALSKGFGGEPLANKYLAFLVTELKPQIDRKFSVHSDQSHTFIAGSSMGGLISMYALFEFPKVFSGAACLSTHWPGTLGQNSKEFAEALMRYVSERIPSAAGHRIYFDRGDKTLDAAYKPSQDRVDSMFKLKGWDKMHYLSLAFPGDDHSEKSWSARLNRPLEFLMSKK